MCTIVLEKGSMSLILDLVHETKCFVKEKIIAYNSDHSMEWKGPWEENLRPSLRPLIKKVDGSSWMQVTADSKKWQELEEAFTRLELYQEKQLIF